MKVFIAFLVLISIFGCDVGPSCEEQGGIYEFSYFAMYPTGPNGSTMLWPIYECKLPKGVNK